MFYERMKNGMTALTTPPLAPKVVAVLAGLQIYTVEDVVEKERIKRYAIRILATGGSELAEKCVEIKR